LGQAGGWAARRQGVCGERARPCRGAGEGEVAAPRRGWGVGCGPDGPEELAAQRVGRFLSKMPG